MKLVRTSALAIGLALISTQPARAQGCCNDFWSCLAAVATGGLSCAVVAAVDELNALKARIDGTRSQAAAEKERVAKVIVDGANDGAARGVGDARAATLATQTARTRAAAAVQKVNAIQLSPQAQSQLRAATNPPPAQGNARIQGGLPSVQVQPSASASANAAAAEAAALRAELERANAKIKELTDQAAQAEADVKNSKARTLRDVGVQGANVMRTAFEASLIAPLVGLVGTLPPPDPLLTAAMVASAIAILDRIEADGNAALALKAKDADKMVGDAKGAVDAKVAELQQMQQNAEKLASAMETVVGSNKKSDLDKLTALLGPPRSSSGSTGLVIAPAIKLAPGSIKPVAFAAMTLKPIGGKAVVSPRIGAGASASVKPGVTMTIPAATMTQYKSKTEADVRTRLAAANAADTEKKRAALIAEAKVKFAKDPKTLAQVLSYLQSAKAQ